MKEEVGIHFRVEIWPPRTYEIRDGVMYDATKWTHESDLKWCRRLIKFLRLFLPKSIHLRIAQNPWWICEYCGAWWTNYGDYIGNLCCERDWMEAKRYGRVLWTPREILGPVKTIRELFPGVFR